MARTQSKTVSKAGKPGKTPAFIAPCLARLARDAPSGPQWLHEIKFDGYRMQAHIENGAVRLLTRKGLDWSGRFGAITKPLATLKVTSAILDGEVVVDDENGVSNFVMLVDDLGAGRSNRMTYYLFDLLFLDGVDLRALPLLERKVKLEALLAHGPKRGALRYTGHVESEGPALFEQACKHGLEGIISKRADKPYTSGRGNDWLKIKCLQNDEFVLGGYVDSTAMKDAIGALLLGYYDGKVFRYAGRVGTGFSHSKARELWARLQRLRLDASPFENSLTAAQRRGVVWVTPDLVAQIDYRAITSDKLLRHASFKSLREDKPAREVQLPAFAK